MTQIGDVVTTLGAPFGTTNAVLVVSTATAGRAGRDVRRGHRQHHERPEDDPPVRSSRKKLEKRA